MKKAIIFGTGDFGHIVHFYLKNDSNYEVIAFTANQSYINADKLLGLPILPFENIESIFPPSKFEMFIAVPYSKMNKVREKIFNEAKEKGYKLLTYINSKAIVCADIEIGENCFVLENNVIQPFCKNWGQCNIMEWKSYWTSLTQLTTTVL